MPQGASGRVRQPRPGVLAVSRSAISVDLTQDNALDQLAESAAERLVRAGAFPQGRQVTAQVNLVISEGNNDPWTGERKETPVDSSEAVAWCKRMAEELRVTSEKVGGSVRLSVTIERIGASNKNNN